MQARNEQLLEALVALVGSRGSVTLDDSQHAPGTSCLAIVGAAGARIEILVLGTEDFFVSLGPVDGFSSDMVPRPRRSRVDRAQAVVEWVLDTVAAVMDFGASRFTHPRIAVLLLGNDWEGQRGAREIVAPDRTWVSWS